MHIELIRIDVIVAVQCALICAYCTPSWHLSAPVILPAHFEVSL